MPAAGESTAADDTVRIGASNMSPWGFLDKQNRESGLLIDFAQKFSAEVHIDHKNYLQPYPRVMHSLASGSVDLAVLFDGPHADNVAIRVGDVLVTEVFVVARASAEPISSFEQLAGMTVGYIRGSKYGEPFDSAPHFTRLPINTMRQGLAMVLSGRIDAMTSSNQAFYQATNAMQLNETQLRRLLVLKGVTGGLYMSRHSKLMNQLPFYRDALKKMDSQGTLKRIFSKPQASGTNFQ